jgi:Helix-turn-helix domain
MRERLVTGQREARAQRHLLDSAGRDDRRSELAWNRDEHHWAVGRMMRTLRLAALLSVDEAAAAVGIAPGRLRHLEAGRDLPDFFEASDLVKPYLLCGPCLGKHLRLAAARDGVVEATSAALLAVLGPTDGDDPDSAGAA